MADNGVRPRIGAVVLHYQRPDLLDETLTGLQAQSRAVDCVVVVDNASGPEAEPRVPDGIELLRMPENVGYAGAMNAGISHLSGVDLVLLLTHECVLADDAVSLLCDELLRDPATGLAAPLLVWLGDRSRVFHAGGKLRGWLQSPTVFGHDEFVTAWTSRRPFSIDFADGSCWLLRREVFERTGGLDERFFLYFEDVDYGVRLRRQGWNMRCVPAATAAVQPGYLPPYAAVRNQLLVLRHHAGALVVAGYVLYALALIAGDLVRLASPYRRWLAAQRACGLRDGLTGRLVRSRFAQPQDPRIVSRVMGRLR